MIKIEAREINLIQILFILSRIILVVLTILEVQEQLNLKIFN